MPQLATRSVEAVSDEGERRVLTDLVSFLNSVDGPTRFAAEGVQSPELPSEVRGAVADLLSRFARGEGVVIGSANSLLTTSQAAEMLGVSRTFVVNLIDQGKLGVEYRNTHRRLVLTDVLRYAEERRRARRGKLDEIAAITERTGGYDGDPF